jgi:hypothetical protein
MELRIHVKTVSVSGIKHVVFVDLAFADLADLDDLDDLIDMVERFLQA